MSTAPGRRTANSSPPRRAAKAPLGHLPLEALGETLEQRVAHLVAETIVDLLEPVEVEQQECAAAVERAVGLEQLGEAVGERAAVQELGQRVVVGLVGTLERVASRLEHEERRDAEQREQDRG